MMTNEKLLFCSRDLHKFMKANEIESIQQLFDISLDTLVRRRDFPNKLLSEWITLRDRFNLLNEN